jgi:hypothetical protein
MALKLASLRRGTATVGYPLNSKPRRRVLDSAASSNLRIQGDFGLVYLLGDTDAQSATIREGKVFVGLSDIGVPAPNGAANTNDNWHVVAHDGRITVMYRLPQVDYPPVPKNGTTRLCVRMPGTGKWRTYQVPGLQPRVKLIGRWIMGAAVSKPRLPNIGSERPAWNGNDSPGADERRRYQQHYPPPDRYHNGRQPTDEVFGFGYLPGVLFLIDTGTGRYHELRTGQGDSEILLVHNGNVYYRVNDSLLAAPLENGSIGPSRLLIRDPAIPDVHWAFWGSSAQDGRENQRLPCRE